MSNNASGKGPQLPDVRSAVNKCSTSSGEDVSVEETSAVNNVNNTTEEERRLDAETTRLKVLLPGNLKGIFSTKLTPNEKLFDPWVPDTLLNLRNSRVVLVPSKVFFRRPDYISPFFNYDKWVLAYDSVNVMMSVPMMQQSDFGVNDSSGHIWKITGDTEEKVDYIISRLESRPSVLHAMLSCCDSTEECSEISVILFLGPKSRCIMMAIERLRKAKQCLKTKRKFVIEIDLSDAIVQWSVKVLHRKYQCTGGKFCISGAVSGDSWADDPVGSGCFACLKKNNKVSVSAGSLRRCDDIISVVGSKGVSTLKQKLAYVQLMTWIESVPPPICDLCGKVMTEKGNQECEEIHHIYRKRQQDIDSTDVNNLDQIESSSISHTELSEGLETIFETENEYESSISSSVTSQCFAEREKTTTSLLKQHNKPMDMDDDEEEEEEDVLGVLYPAELDNKLVDEEKYQKWLRNDQLFYLPEYNFEKYFNHGHDDQKQSFLGEYANSIASTLENSFISPRSDKLSIKRNGKKLLLKPMVNSMKVGAAITQNGLLPIKAKCLDKEYQIPLQMFSKYAKSQDHNRTKLSALTIDESSSFQGHKHSKTNMNGPKNVRPPQNTDSKDRSLFNNKYVVEHTPRTARKFSDGVTSTDLPAQDRIRHSTNSELRDDKHVDTDNVNSTLVSNVLSYDRVQLSTKFESRVDINLDIDDLTNDKMHQNDDRETQLPHIAQEVSDDRETQLPHIAQEVSATSPFPDVLATGSYGDTQIRGVPFIRSNNEHNTDNIYNKKGTVVPPNSETSFNNQNGESTESVKYDNCSENICVVEDSNTENTLKDYSKNSVQTTEDTNASSGNIYVSATGVVCNSLVIHHTENNTSCLSQEPNSCVKEKEIFDVPDRPEFENGYIGDTCAEHADDADTLTALRKDSDSDETTPLTTGSVVIPWAPSSNYARRDNSVHSPSINQKSDDNSLHSVSPNRNSSDISLHSPALNQKSSDNSLHSVSPNRKSSDNSLHNASPNRKSSDNSLHNASPNRKSSDNSLHSSSPNRKLYDGSVHSALLTGIPSDNFVRNASSTRESAMLSPSFAFTSKRENEIVSPDNILRLSRASVGVLDQLVDQNEHSGIQPTTRENTWVTSQGSSATPSASPVQTPAPLLVNENPVHDPVKSQSVIPPQAGEPSQKNAACAPNRRREAFQEIEMDMSKTMRYSFREKKAADARSVKDASLTSTKADPVGQETVVTSGVKISPPRPKRPPGFVHPYYEDVGDCVFNPLKRFDVVNFLTFQSDNYSEEF